MEVHLRKSPHGRRCVSAADVNNNIATFGGNSVGACEAK
jgi:hypothetical protein